MLNLLPRRIRLRRPLKQVQGDIIVSSWTDTVYTLPMYQELLYLSPVGYIFTRFSKAEFVTTDKELMDIAAAAIIGFRSPNAAMGIAAVL